MKTQYTPGPWHVERGERCLFICDSRNDVPSIAHLGRTGMDHDDEANARLIASAPELLEALEMALCAHSGDWQHGIGWEKKARTAIAKAKGDQ